MYRKMQAYNNISLWQHSLIDYYIFFNTQQWYLEFFPRECLYYLLYAFVFFVYIYVCCATQCKYTLLGILFDF